MKWLLIPVLCLICFGFFAQRPNVDTARIMQISGVVISEDNLEPLPYTTVWNRSIKKGVIADFYGFLRWFLFRVIPWFSIIMDAKNLPTLFQTP